ncbi:BgtAc-31547, partial [Blumeria graminis f. sp. tritici]
MASVAGNGVQPSTEPMEWTVVGKPLPTKKVRPQQPFQPKPKVIKRVILVQDLEEESNFNP